MNHRTSRMEEEEAAMTLNGTIHHSLQVITLSVCLVCLSVCLSLWQYSFHLSSGVNYGHLRKILKMGPLLPIEISAVDKNRN